ncbi:hypothetical protein GCM10009415_01080 [Chitinophaga japonensis]
MTDSARYVDALNRLSLLYLPQNLDTAFGYVNQAREIAERQAYAKGKADVWRNLGNYYALRANSYLSYRFYLEALQAYEALGDSAAACQVLSNIGIYYKYAGQLPSAVHYTAMAMDKASRLRHDSVYAGVLVNYYFVHIADSARLDSAQWALAKARSIAERYHDERTLLNMSKYEAHELLRRGDAAGAEKLLLQVIRNARENGFTYIAMYASAQLAGYKGYLQQADSMQYKVDMVNYGMAGAYREVILPMVTTLYKWYSEHGQQAAAARYSRLMLDILEKEQAARTQGELDYTAYFMQGRRLNALRLQHRSQQQQLDKELLESRRRRYVLIGIYALLPLAALLLAFFYYAYKRSRQRAALLAEKYRVISEKNALLSRHDDFKNKLISLIAHDFRQPLVHLLEITDVLRDNPLGQEETAALMVKVERNSRNTLHTFDSILRWINSQLSGFVYLPEQCAPAALLQEALESLAEMISEKQLQVRVSIPDHLRVMAEREMLQFVHRNFIHNAVKFSSRRGAISITATVAGGQVTVTVADEGPGIPADILPHLFEYRSNDRSGKGKQQGAGLALIICRDFMQMMNGSVQAVNQPGRGAALSYTLPLVN